MLKKKLKPEAGPNPVKTVEIPVENIPVAPPIPKPKEIVLEKGRDYEVKVENIVRQMEAGKALVIEEKPSDHEMFNMLIADIKNLMPTDEEKRRMNQQLSYVCPESRDLLATIVKILSRF